MDVSRQLYRSLLALHPRGFRQEFGEEMLWIFDQSRTRGTTARMLSDCFLSLFRQHVNAEDYIERPVANFGQEIAGFEFALLPLARATVLGSLLLMAFISALAHYTPTEYPASAWPAPRVYRPTCEDFRVPLKANRKSHVAHAGRSVLSK